MPEAQKTMFEALLMVKEPGNKDWDGKGKKSFKVLPQVGEFIELEINDKGYLYKVVAITHPGEPTQYPVDIYAVQLGKTLDVYQELFENS